MNVPSKNTPLRLQSLVHYEQHVNDRHFTSPAPAIPSTMLPENATSFSLAWKKMPKDRVSLHCSDEAVREQMEHQLSVGKHLLVPIHPLDEKKFKAHEIVHSGRIVFSASYRTVFFRPERGGPFFDWISEDKLLMLKLHLDEPLPGIPGDRRLTEEIVEKCVYLSVVIPELIGQDSFTARLDVIPEFFGVCGTDCGAIFRRFPITGLLPVFSLYSRDIEMPDTEPVLVSRVRGLFGQNSADAANQFGEEFGGPLVESLIAGFRQGISLEMHGQNTLVQLGKSTLIERVYYRDLEGVVVFNDYRIRRGLKPIEFPSGKPLHFFTDASVHRLFNRNIDHDLGRIFMAALDTLCRYKYFDAKERQMAEQSIRRTVRASIARGEINDLNRFARFLPYSRAPWGSGRRPSHYFRTRFR